MRLSPLVGNSGWSLAVQIVRAGSLAVVLILLARYLGPTAFGVFAVAFSIVKIFSVVAGFGLERVSVKRIVQGEGPPHVTRIIWIRVMGGTMAYVLAVATAAALDRSMPGLVKLVVIMGPALILHAASTYEFVFQAKSRMGLTFLATAPPLLLSSGLKIFAMTQDASLVTFAQLEVLEAALVAAGLLGTYIITRPLDRSGGTAALAVRTASWPLLREAFPLLLSSLAVTAYLRADILMLGIMSAPAEVGIYTAAAQLSEVWSLLPMALMPAILPYFLALRDSDQESFGSKLNLMYSCAASTAIAIALVITLLAPWLLPLLFGEKYDASVSVLQIHIWSAVFIYLGVAQSVWDVSENRLWLSFTRTALGAVLNIALNLALIPIHGPHGAAVATVISYSASAVWFNILSRHTRGVFVLQVQAMLFIPIIRMLRTPDSASVR